MEKSGKGHCDPIESLFEKIEAQYYRNALSMKGKPSFISYNIGII